MAFTPGHTQPVSDTLPKDQLFWNGKGLVEVVLGNSWLIEAVGGGRKRGTKEGKAAQNSLSPKTEAPANSRSRYNQ